MLNAEFSIRGSPDGRNLRLSLWFRRSLRLWWRCALFPISLNIRFRMDRSVFDHIFYHHLSEIRDETRAFGAKAIEQIQSIVIGMIPDHRSAVFHCRPNRDTMVENSVRIFQRFGFGFQISKPLCTRLYFLYIPGIVGTQPDFIPPDGYVKGRLFDNFIQNGTF